ncbi:MAG: hypothetical protein ACI4SQ_04975 [Eubacterium sp.]
MMMALLVLKTRCKEFYEKNYRIVRSVLKILIGLIIYNIILYQLPFSKELREYGLPLSIILALISGFVPDSVIIFFATALTVLEIASVSYIVAACFLFIILIYFLLFGRYTKSQSYLVLLISALWPLNIVFAVPIVAALFLNLAMIPACLVGVFVRYILLAIENYYMISQNSVDTGNTLEGLQYCIDFLLQNKEMLLYMITFVVVYLLVFLIRRGRFSHASQIGIFVGLVMGMAGVIAGDAFWSIDTDLMKLMLGIAVTAAISYLIQFFRMTLDYTGVHKLQFEDEDYLYYVKAVPKMKVAPGDKTVTRIEEDRDEGIIDLKEEIEKVLEEDMNSDQK